MYVLQHPLTYVLCYCSFAVCPVLWCLTVLSGRDTTCVLPSVAGMDSGKYQVRVYLNEDFGAVHSVLYVFMEGEGGICALLPVVFFPPDLCAVPKTIRLVEGSGYVVEVVSSHCWDVSVDSLDQSARTHCMVLTRTSIDGRQKTVNVLSVAKEYLKRAKHVCGTPL